MCPKRERTAQGIDYHDYRKVDQLPKAQGRPVTAIAGVWGDNRNLRCLFVDDDGNRLMRVVYASTGYEIPAQYWR